jgi:hypothetical protein
MLEVALPGGRFISSSPGPGPKALQTWLSLGAAPADLWGHAGLTSYIPLVCPTQSGAIRAQGRVGHGF